MIWLILAALVLAAITIRAVHRSKPMPPEMEAAEEQWNILFQERVVYQRPLSERLGEREG